MKKLILMRHAKSGWNGREDDFDRSLTENGKKDAAKMGKWLADQNTIPEKVLCSSAFRTTETYLMMSKDLKMADVEYHDALYLASCKKIYQHLQALPNDVSCAMLIAHNPGIHEAMLRLTGMDYPTDMQKCPSGTIAVFEFDIGWQSVGTEIIRFRHYITPKNI